MIKLRKTRAKAVAPADSAVAVETDTADSGKPPRPLSDWLAQHPPGYVSSCSLESVEPLTLAAAIHLLAARFSAWLNQPRADRWDTFALQTLSANLYSSFRSSSDDEFGVELKLLELDWPVGSENVCRELRALQELLAAPLAVYKASRAPLDRGSYPCAQDFRLAEETLEASQYELRRAVIELGNSLRTYAVRHAELDVQRIA